MAGKQMQEWGLLHLWNDKSIQTLSSTHVTRQQSMLHFYGDVSVQPQDKGNETSSPDGHVVYIWSIINPNTPLSSYSMAYVVVYLVLDDDVM